MTKSCRRNECQVVFETKDSRKMYCSRSCAAKVNNTVYPKRTARLDQNRRCLACDEPLTTSQKSYCSSGCRGIDKATKVVEAWLAGEDSGSTANGLMKKPIRRYMISVAGGRCSSPTCYVPGGWSVPNPITGKPILTVDHIDGNWKNNAVDNLIVLCYNCHTLTETFGSLNKESAGIRGSGNRAYPEYSKARKDAEKSS